MSISDNLRCAIDPHDRRSYLVDLVRPRSDSLTETVLTTLHEFGLPEDLDQVPEKLPYADRRLLAIGRAVAAQPGVVMLDEPAAGLDRGQRRNLAAAIRRLGTEYGMAVLLIEHDVEMVFETCDRVYVLSAGKLIASGTPDEIRMNDKVVDAYLGAPEPASI